MYKKQRLVDRFIMGNTVTNTICVPGTKLEILLEKVYYFPGEIIKGSILVKSDKILKNGQLLFSINQTESWNLKFFNKITTSHCNSMFIIDSLLSFEKLTNCSLTEGVTIPFSFQFPNKMTPSFEYSLYEKQGYVRNKLRVRIIELNSFTSCYIVILEPAKITSSPISLISEDHSKIMIIFGLDNLFIEGTIPSDNFSFFSSIPLQVVIKSQAANLPIHKIIVKLKRRINFLKDYQPDSFLEYEDELYSTSLEKCTKDTVYSINLQINEPDQYLSRYNLENINMSTFDKKDIL